MADFTRFPIRFRSQGVNFNAPLDDPELIQKGYWPLLKNMRSYQDGRVESRNGIASLSVTTTAGADKPVHSIRRLNDPQNATFTRIVGGGTKVFYGTGGTLTAATGATGFSGNPLSMIPYEPDQSPDSWMYLGDSSKMGKIKADGTFRAVGIRPPNFEPTVGFASPSTSDVDTFQANTGWAADGTVLGAPGAVVARVNTTTTASVADSTAAGWYTITPAAIAGIFPGMFLGIAGAGTHQLVQTVRPAAFTTTVGSITYDSGTSGACTIQPAVGAIIDTDSMLYLNASEYVRVTAVTNNPDGTVQAFRCVTVGTIAAGQAIAGVASFRAYCTGAPTGAGAITDNYMPATFAGPAGVGTLTKTAALDLSKVGTRPILDDDVIHISIQMSNFASLIEGKLKLSMDANNAFMWSFQPSAFQNALTNAATTQAARTNLLGQTVVNTPYVLPIPPSFYDPNNQWNSSAVQQSTISPIDPYTQSVGTGGDVYGPTSDPLSSALPYAPTSSYLAPGQAQWMELFLRVGEALRIGTDPSLTLKNVATIQVSLNVTATGGAETVFLDAWWIGGTFGPDVGDIGTPYCYRIRGRDSTTGARSNAGPPIRPGGGISPRRQSVTVTFANMPTATDSSWTSVDKIDVFRFGGSLNSWFYVGSVTNSPGSSTTLTFTDNYPDDFLSTQPLLEMDQDQPFPVIGQRIGSNAGAGTGCYTTGTTVVLNAGTVPLSLTPGNIINIAGVDFVTHNFPITITKVELEDNVGTQGTSGTGVAWYINAPVTIGNPLPCLWGPLENFMFACGDPVNPGRLYWMNGNNPDASAQGNYIDVTAPSEPLMNGLLYDGRAFVWSTDRMFAIYPTFEGSIIAQVGGGQQVIGAGLASSLGGAGGAPVPFRVIEIPNSRGLYTRWGLCVGPKIWTLGRDGIYETMGGEPTSTTDSVFRGFFPVEGVAGSSPAIPIQTPLAPDLTYTNASTRASDFRLAWANGYLYFDYVDTAYAQNTLVVETPSVQDILPARWYDVFAAGTVKMHYGEEGTLDGFSTLKGAGIMSLLVGGSDNSGTPKGVVAQVQNIGTDFGVAIPWTVTLPAFNAGDAWLNKTWGDSIIDCDRQGNTITATPYFDLYGTAGVAVTISAGAGRQQYNISASNTISTNQGLLVTGTGRAQLYIWEPSFVPKPEQTVTRPTDWDDDGYIGAKWLQGIVLTCDTFGVAKQVQVQGDGGAIITTLTVNHNGEQEKAYSWDPTVANATTHQMRVIPIDTIPWRGPGTGIFKVKWVWEPEPELVTTWTTQPTSLDFDTFSHIREFLIPLRSTATVTINLTQVDSSTTYAFSIPATGGVQKKVYLVGVPQKSKMWQWSAVATDGTTGFRVYVKDMSVKAKQWADMGPYHTLKPFGDASRIRGASI